MPLRLLDLYHVKELGEILRKFDPNSYELLVCYKPNLIFMRSIIEFFLTKYMTVFQLLFLVFLALDLIDNKKWDKLAVGPTTVFCFCMLC